MSFPKAAGSIARRALVLVCLLGALAPFTAHATNTFVVAVYNLENWLMMERTGGTNSGKPVASREAVVSVLTGIRPDVLGVVEIGTTEDLADLQSRLRLQGLDLPHTEWVQAADPTRHVALLSRFPITARFSRTNDTYQMGERAMRIQRGILDVRIQPNPGYSFHALVVHLKSRRETEEGNQATMRLEEARLLRRHLDNVLASQPAENFVVMGDFNDLPAAPPVQTIAGTNETRLFVLHPRDHRGYDTTYFWRGKREWSRIDYIMTSPGMSNEYLTGSAHIAAPTSAFTASDHRALHASFVAVDEGIRSVAITPPQPAPPAAPFVLPSLYLLLVTVLLLAIIIFFAHKRSRPQPPA